MTTEFALVIMTIVAWWCGLFAIFSGVGLLVRRAFGLTVEGATTCILSFWVGWVFALLILQFWHLWLKIDGWTLVFLAAIGTIGLLWNVKDLWRLVRAYRMRNFWVPLVLLLLALWVANRAIGPILHGDTGLYHMTAVKWAASYPIVPGLGNLHGRLAYNNSFFLYAALFETGPWLNKSHYIANGLLLFVLLTQLFLSLHKMLLSNHKARTFHLFNGLLFPVALSLMFHPIFSGLLPDVTVFILGIVLSSILFNFIINKDLQGVEEGYNLFCITMIAIGGITIKLSFLVLGSTTFIVAIIAWIVRTSEQYELQRNKVILWIICCSTVLLLIWMLRSVILSGYIGYPSTIIAFPVEWRVPRSLALSEGYWIRSWARTPWVSWTEVLGNSSWLHPWLQNLPSDIVKSTKIALFAVVFYLVAASRIVDNARRKNSIHLAILVPSLASLLFWFVSAPDPRFLGSCIWVLGTGLIALAVGELKSIGTSTLKIMNSAFIVIFSIFVIPIYEPLFIRPNKEKTPFYDVVQPEYISVALSDSVKINVPKLGDFCWNIPIPCTPYFRSNLALRMDHIDSGFILDNTIVYADMHQTGIPKGVVSSPGLGISLVHNTWYEFEDSLNIRWMRNPGKILIYTEHPTSVKLSLRPFAMKASGISGDEGYLIVKLNDSPRLEFSIKSEMMIEVVLQLRRDFNIVSLELAAGNFIPSEVNPHSKDTRSLSVAFYPMEITRITPPNEAPSGAQLSNATAAVFY